MNKYSITIVRQGYIRTNNDFSGNEIDVLIIKFEKKF